MNRTSRFILFLLLVIVLSIPTVVVFAKELGLLTISGPGIKGEMALKDTKAISLLEQYGFFDQTAFVQPPQNLNLDAGYTVTAHLNLDGKVVPFVQMVYYAADQGQPGYVHYTGRLEGETLQSVDQWQVLTRDADNTFRGVMSANHITLQSALITVPAAVSPAVEAKPAAPIVSSASIQTSYLVPAVLASILLLVGASLMLKRRTISNPTT